MFFPQLVKYSSKTILTLATKTHCCTHHSSDQFHRTQHVLILCFPVPPPPPGGGGGDGIYSLASIAYLYHGIFYSLLLSLLHLTESVLGDHANGRDFTPFAVLYLQKIIYVLFLITTPEVQF